MSSPNYLNKPLFLVVSIFVILIILLMIYVNLNLYRNRFSIPTIDINKKVDNRNRKICLLLTMYIGDEKEKRRTFYLDVARKWIQQKDIEIFIVDSSGRYLFGQEEYKNLHQYSFKQEGERKKLCPSVKEKDSIINILNANFDGIDDYDFIYKLTGKYFIENFKSVCIDCLPLDADYVLQNNTYTHGQNTELIGFRPSIAKKELLSDISSVKGFENAAADLHYKYPKRNIYRLPRIDINNNIKRSDGSIITNL